MAKEAVFDFGLSILRAACQAFSISETCYRYIFENIEEVQDAATQWRWTYNNERPNMALGGITPKQKLARSMLRAHT